MYFQLAKTKIALPAIIFLLSIYIYSSDKNIMDTYMHWINNSKFNLVKCIPTKQIHKPGKHTKTPSGMFELNLNLLFTNTSHGPPNELCAISLTRTVTDCTFERQNWACGIVLLNNFTGVNNRGGLKSFNWEKVTLSLELFKHLLGSCSLSSTRYV